MWQRRASPKHRRWQHSLTVKQDVEESTLLIKQEVEVSTLPVAQGAQEQRKTQLTWLEPEDSAERDLPSHKLKKT